MLERAWRAAQVNWTYGRSEPLAKTVDYRSISHLGGARHGTAIIAALPAHIGFGELDCGADLPPCISPPHQVPPPSPVLGLTQQFLAMGDYPSER